MMEMPPDYGPPAIVPDADESPTIAKLAGALAKAQGMMRSAAKDSANPFFRSKYADLDACWEAARAPLASNDLAVVQRVRISPGWVHMKTMLLHSSGEWMRDVSDWPVKKPPKRGTDGKEYEDTTPDAKPYVPTPQVLGSVISYARRYTLCALVGITAGEDDDGNASSHQGEPAYQQQRQAARKEKRDTPAQYGPPATPASPPPPPVPNAALKEDEAAKKHRSRCAALWKAAQAKGMNSTADFKEWLTMVIARPVISSQELTEAELALAEQAIKTHGATAEPGSTG